MTEKRRADLVGAEKAVAETLDEVNARMHGMLSSSAYQQEFLDWLRDRGYVVAPVDHASDAVFEWMEHTRVGEILAALVRRTGSDAVTLVAEELGRLSLEESVRVEQTDAGNVLVEITTLAGEN